MRLGCSEQGSRGEQGPLAGPRVQVHPDCFWEASAGLTAAKPQAPKEHASNISEAWDVIRKHYEHPNSNRDSCCSFPSALTPFASNTCTPLFSMCLSL